MSIQSINDIEFGVELPSFEADTSLPAVREFAAAVGWSGGRFESHELAKKEGLPGALVPGIMGMGFFTSMIQHWCPSAHIEHIDTVFRAPLIADEPCQVSALVTDIDEDQHLIELDLTIKNPKDETRVFGTAQVRIK